MILPLLIVLHSVTGVPIEINPVMVTHLRYPEQGTRLFTEGARCMINMTDGKYVTVRETCAEVRALIEQRK